MQMVGTDYLGGKGGTDAVIRREELTMNLSGWKRLAKTFSFRRYALEPVQNWGPVEVLNPLTDSYLPPLMENAGE